MLQTIKYSKLSPDSKSPMRKNPTDAGIDFYSNESLCVPAHSMKIVHTGVTVEIPNGFVLSLKPKSRNNHLIGAGIIDSGYHPGEILVKVANISNDDMVIGKGDAIAQGLYLPIETPDLQEVPIEELIHDGNRSGKGGIVDQVK